MKTSCLTIVLLSSIVAGAQTTSLATQTTAGKSALPKPTAFSVAGRDANSRVWERYSFEKAPDGTLVAKPHRIVELANGMHFLKNGKWVESQEQINVLPQGGAEAVQGQHQAYFPGDIFQGVIQLVTADGKRLRGRPVGISYDDDQNTVLIAQLTNSIGVLVSPNQVVYPDAFAGVKADLVYTYRKGGFEQDVVLREQPPAPESFGLNRPVRLQLLTEFTGSSEPAQRAAMVNRQDNLQDTTLTFGGMKMVQGRAFSINDSAGGRRTKETPTYKSWLHLQGRTFLIEEVPYDRIALQLKQLPTMGRTDTANTNLYAENSVLGKVSTQRLLPPVREAQPDTQKIQLARLDLSRRPGVVLDYVAVNTAADFTFQCDTTYYVSAAVNLSGTTTIEGGTVIKYDTNSTSTVNILETVNCATAPYRPAIFTLISDSTVGEAVPGELNPQCSGTLNLTVVEDIGSDATFSVYDDNGNCVANLDTAVSTSCSFTAGLGQHFTASAGPDNGGPGGSGEFWTTLNYGCLGIEDMDNPYLEYSEGGSPLCTPPAVSSVGLSLASGGSLNNLNFRNLNTGVQSDGVLSVTNLQFVNCGAAFDMENASLYAGNVLMSYVGLGFAGRNFQATVEQLTFDNGIYVAEEYGSGPSGVALANTLLTAVSGGYANGNVTVTRNVVDNRPSSAGVYQTTGAGGYYLADNTYRNKGTTGISPSLKAQLSQKTTWPPVVNPGGTTISLPTTLPPQAARDSNANPDLGYHYDPLDYVFGGVEVNANVTFTAGTAVGWYDTSSGPAYGIIVDSGATVSFNGIATAPCWLARYDMVQEADNGNWTATGWLSPITCNNPNPYYSASSPALLMQFTKFSSRNWGDQIRDYSGNFVISANNCEFYGAIGGYNIQLNFTNCLFYRYATAVTCSGYGSPSLSMQNCTTEAGTFDTFCIQHWDSVAWPVLIKDCAFDGTTINVDTLGLVCDYNSFLTGANRLPIQGLHDRILTSGYNWRSSWLGNFYLPPDSPLIDAGGITADQVGLYHFTTQTSQVPETNSIVDIGYHYVAALNGVPTDTDGDSIPDYIEDANGNGVVDAGETSWTNWDTDGDGLSDSEEPKILLDANNPSLGYLDPLNPDTGGTGIPDGQKDSDHDGISNLGELRIYGSNPSNAHTFNSATKDAEYLFTAKAGYNTTMASFNVTYDYITRLLRFSISGGIENGIYDMYFVNNIAAFSSDGPLRWQARRVYTGIQCDSAGNAVFEMEPPEPISFFQILYAGDADGDGLTDGYEAWFNYNGKQTVIDDVDSDGDGMKDGWEVAYGLDPTVSTGADGASGNPDGDNYSNLQEFSQTGGNFNNASFDPLEVYGTAANRPVVSVFADDEYPSCEQTSFTIYRTAGYGGNYDNPLTVYYSVGGTLSYDLGNYRLDPAPPDWPRIYSAVIPAGQQSVTVIVDAPGVSKNPGEVETVAVSLTPYAVSPVPQAPDPLSWAYVLDMYNNRATITFDNQYLRPTVYGQNVQTCHGIPKQIFLSGVDGCGANLTFSVVSVPSSGSLSTITSIDGTTASVTYTPNASFCGQDSFTFKANDGVWDSAPATVTIDVGDPNPTANCLDVMTVINTPVTFTLSGSQTCSGNLTFAPVAGSGPNDGTLGTITQIDPDHASVTYTPNSDPAHPNGFLDGFDFTVNDCYTTAKNHVTINVVSAPVLTTECRQDRIILHWTVPDWMEKTYGSDYFNGFKIYRCESTTGSCTPTALYTTVTVASARTYADTGAQPGMTYCYRVTFTHLDSCDGTTIYESPYSNTDCNQECFPTYPNGIDVAFIVDNTESIGDEPLTQLENGIAAVLDDINLISGGNYRLALVTPDDDQVNVRLPFSDNNRVAFVDTLNAVEEHGGDGDPESTDECLNTIVNALSSANRVNPRNCPLPNPSNPLQINDFTPGFRSGALKLVIMITDAVPGGFCDASDGGAKAAFYALEASTNCIKINAIQVGTDSSATIVMLNYYKTTCGWYEQVPTDGTGIADAVDRMLYVAGYCNCP